MSHDEVTHYDVLGVAPEAPVGEIRAAFVLLARRHHPDYFTAAPPAERADAERRMRTINEAWSVLSDPRRRVDYDADHGLAPDPGAFRPLEPDEADDTDPRDEPDVPYRTVAPAEERRTRLATLVPVGLFAAATVAFVLGLVLSLPALLATGVAALLASAAGFVVVPLLVLARARRDEG